MKVPLTPHPLMVEIPEPNQVPASVLTTKLRQQPISC